MRRKKRPEACVCALAWLGGAVTCRAHILDQKESLLDRTYSRPPELFWVCLCAVWVSRNPVSLAGFPCYLITFDTV